MSGRQPSVPGGIAAADFLRRQWQKEALLCRAAIPATSAMPDRAALCALAARDDVESRLVVRQRGRWTLSHGPFGAADMKRLPARDWTLLVSGLNLHCDWADALLRRFAFIPYARLDDVMASYAAPGGGVGPHFDSYDVFLLQGFGRRRWRYGRQADLTLRPGLPLKILQHFAPDHDETLQPGDMLYLPPHYAHDGVAIDACVTYSIGFRAPAAQELGQAFLDFVRDRLQLDGRYEDPHLSPTREPARIGADMQRQLRAMLEAIAWNADTLERFVGSFLSEPKADVFFDPPKRLLSRPAFRVRIARRGVSLDRRTRMLYDAQRFYMNGVESDIADARALVQLANDRQLSPAASAALPDAASDRLHDWYRHGYLAPGT